MFKVGLAPGKLRLDVEVLLKDDGVELVLKGRQAVSAGLRQGCQCRSLQISPICAVLCYVSPYETPESTL